MTWSQYTSNTHKWFLQLFGDRHRSTPSIDTSGFGPLPLPGQVSLCLQIREKKSHPCGLNSGYVTSLEFGKFHPLILTCPLKNSGWRNGPFWGDMSVPVQWIIFLGGCRRKAKLDRSCWWTKADCHEWGMLWWNLVLPLYWPRDGQAQTRRGFPESTIHHWANRSHPMTSWLADTMDSHSGL